MSELYKQFTEKFKKSDSLSFVDTIAKSMSAEEFKKLSFTVMKIAYDKKRHKAVEYMLKFHEKNEPILLLKIHLSVMLEDKTNLPIHDKMLKVLVQHYSPELCSKTLYNIVEYEKNRKGPDYSAKKTVIENMILQETLPKNENNSKKMKI